MFIQPCYIRKNSQELRNKLEELGYHKFKYCRDEFEKDDVLAVIEMYNNEPIYTYINYRNMENMGYINCGTNEELFLAIATLRDDSDMNQWFVHNASKQFIECIHDEFHSCAIILGENNEYLGYHDYKDEFHKATVEELIEHFKND